MRSVCSLLSVVLLNVSGLAFAGSSIEFQQQNDNLLIAKAAGFAVEELGNNPLEWSSVRIDDCVVDTETSGFLCRQVTFTAGSSMVKCSDGTIQQAIKGSTVTFVSGRSPSEHFSSAWETGCAATPAEPAPNKK